MFSTSISPGDRDALDVEVRLAVRHGAAVHLGELLALVADHVRDPAFGVGVRDEVLRDGRAVPQHGHTVAHGRDLREPVRDVDDGAALVDERADDAAHVVHVGLAERRSGLVHDDDACVGGERAGDRGELLVRDRKVSHHGVGREGRADALEVAERLRSTAATQHHAEPARRVAEEQVLSDREVGEQVELLVDHGDTRGEAVLW